VPESGLQKTYNVDALKSRPSRSVSVMQASICISDRSLSIDLVSFVEFACVSLLERAAAVLTSV
jgi:hypothetical protein